MILDYCVIGHIAPTTPKIVDYDNGSSVALAIIVRSVRSVKMQKSLEPSGAVPGTFSGCPA